MEDIDEFFEETTFSEKQSTKPILRGSKPKPSSTKNSAPNTPPRKTLGVGRPKAARSTSKQVITPKIRPDSPVSEVSSRSPDPIQTDSFAGLNDFDDYDVENQDPIEDDRNMTLSPIPLLSLDTDKRDSTSNTHLVTPKPKLKPAKSSSTSSSKLTKSMALGRKRKVTKIIESEEEEEEDKTQEEEEREEVNELRLTYTEDVTDSDSSDGGHPSSSYKPSQPELITRPSPLPSPPPEGLRRSKRTRIAPLAYWRNERIVYSRASQVGEDLDQALTVDIKNVPLQEIREVVHVPEVQKKNAARRGRLPKDSAGTAKPKKSKDEPEVYDYESDPEIEGSQWFRHKSLEMKVFVDEKRETRRVAWTPDGYDFMPPKKNRRGLQLHEKFQVAFLNGGGLDGMEAGILELPFEGFKALSTSGQTQYVFHVVKGLIEVTINTDKFVATKGCSIEVLKQNTFGFKNIGQGTARLFYVQGET